MSTVVYPTRLVLFALLAVLLPPFGEALARSACPVDLTCIEDARVAYEKALALAESYGTDAILVVVDIDDTLLTADQYLGSDDWFYWQKDLMRRNPASRALVSDSFDGLLAAQRLLYALGPMHTTQPDLPALLDDLQNRGIRLIALTARSFKVRDVTRRELLRNGYDLSRNPLPPRPGFVGDDPFLPYHPGNLRAAGLSPGEAARLGLGEPRPVSYRSGLYMTAGQHKGAMLRSLLARAGLEFRALVFLDDRPGNVHAMADAYPEGGGTELSAYVYNREEPWDGEAESAAARRAACVAWNRLATTLVEIFPSRRGLPAKGTAAAE